MSDPPEDFLRRWSRLKHEAATPPAVPAEAGQVAKPAGEAASVELPPLESLTPESDFSVFMQPQVDDNLRRSALKRLFQDPRFNQMDGLDIYVGDYTALDPIPDEMLAQLVQARNVLGLGKDEPVPQQEAGPALESDAATVAELPAAALAADHTIETNSATPDKMSQSPSSEA
ncbi:MAG TPA: DUF3306 domain-containing protein [Burkholderiales bacterium]|nr:DUF3306 domain-containing protein [Burkholderiales bacterium]